MKKIFVDSKMSMKKDYLEDRKLSELEIAEGLKRNTEWLKLKCLENENACLAEIPLKEALSGTEAEEWRSAIVEEFQALIKNCTWDLVNHPENRNVIGSSSMLS